MSETNPPQITLSDINPPPDPVEDGDPGPPPDKPVLTWKSEASMWRYLEAGQKLWEARLWDDADDRCHALAYSGEDAFVVRFENKATRQIIAFDLDRWIWGHAALAEYGQGWFFMYLGARRPEHESYRAEGCEACYRTHLGGWESADACADHLVRCGRPLPQGGWCPERLASPGTCQEGM